MARAMAVDNPPSPAPTIMIFKATWLLQDSVSGALNGFRNRRQLLGYVVLFHSSVGADLPAGSTEGTNLQGRQLQVGGSHAESLFSGRLL